MLVSKNGILRSISERDLHAYLEKGYIVFGTEKMVEAATEIVAADPKAEAMKPIEAAEDTEIEVKEKPLHKMTTAELTEKALEIGIDISDCQNNAERAAAIKDKLKEIEEGGE